jgi:hypothetical protein
MANKGNLHAQPSFKNMPKYTENAPRWKAPWVTYYTLAVGADITKRSHQGMYRQISSVSDAGMAASSAA